MAAVKIQHKNCLQSTLRKKIINTLFARLGRSILGKTVPLVLGTALGLRPRAVLKTSGTVFPNTDRPRRANNVFIIWQGKSERSDWFFLGRDFTIQTVSTQTVQAVNFVVVVVFKSRQIYLQLKLLKENM